MGMCKLLQMMRASFLQRLRRGPPFSHDYNTTDIPSSSSPYWRTVLLTWKGTRKICSFHKQIRKKSLLLMNEIDLIFLLLQVHVKSRQICMYAFMKNRSTYDSFLVFHRILRNCKIAWFAKSRHVLWWCTLFSLEIKINDSANYDLAKYIRDGRRRKFSYIFAI